MCAGLLLKRFFKLIFRNQLSQESTMVERTTC